MAAYECECGMTFEAEEEFKKHQVEAHGDKA